jgi:hypothetical protein
MINLSKTKQKNKTNKSRKLQKNLQEIPMTKEMRLKREIASKYFIIDDPQMVNCALTGCVLHTLYCEGFLTLTQLKDGYFLKRAFLKWLKKANILFFNRTSFENALFPKKTYGATKRCSDCSEVEEVLFWDVYKKEILSLTQQAALILQKITLDEPLRDSEIVLLKDIIDSTKKMIRDFRKAQKNKVT